MARLNTIGQLEKMIEDHRREIEKLEGAKEVIVALNGKPRTTRALPAQKTPKPKAIGTTPEAILRMLTRPMTPTEIYEAIKKAGWTTANKKPMGTIHAALQSLIEQKKIKRVKPGVYGRV